MRENRAWLHRKTKSELNQDEWPEWMSDASHWATEVWGWYAWSGEYERLGFQSREAAIRDAEREGFFVPRE
jgi:hypothetical protein